MCQQGHLSALNVHHRLWLETPAPEGLLAARSQQSKAQLRRLVVERGRVLRPEGRGQKAVWGVKFKEVPGRTQVGAVPLVWLHLVAP